jgi:hypothetical protein
MDVLQKFIIEGDYLVMAKSIYHKSLVSRLDWKGGGFWSFDEETTTFTFFGRSHDFGKASMEDIKKCIDNDKVFSIKCMTHSIASIYDFNYRDELGNIIELKKSPQPWNI